MAWTACCAVPEGTESPLKGKLKLRCVLERVKELLDELQKPESRQERVLKRVNGDGLEGTRKDTERVPVKAKLQFTPIYTGTLTPMANESVNAWKSAQRCLLSRLLATPSTIVFLPKPSHC